MKNKFFKWFREDECHHGLHYHDGLNKDPLKFDGDKNHSCVPGGLYFANATNITTFTSLGGYIREVKIPAGYKIVRDPDGNKFRCHALFLCKRRRMDDINTWRWMKTQNVRFRISDLIEACEYNKYQIAKFLLDNHVDLKQDTCDDCIETAASYGRFALVKLLLDYGATTINNNALEYAIRNNHFRVVKYLIERGVPIDEDLIDNIASINNNPAQYVRRIFIKRNKKNGINHD